MISLSTDVAPRIAALCMMKNECDIVELFLKINTQFFDRVFILDHNSDDSTPVIISMMKRRGFPVVYVRLNNSAYDQAKITGAYLNKIALLEEFDYIIPIDADEFISADHRSINDLKCLVRNLVNPVGVGVIPWRTYCPTITSFAPESAPLYSFFKMRKIEPRQYFKVVVGNEYAKTCTVSMGNHLAFNDKYPTEPVNVPIFLQHVPVRSAEQIIRKAILGSHTLASTKSRPPGAASQWEKIADLVRRKNFKLQHEDLLVEALMYAALPGDPNVTELVDDAPHIGTADDKIEFNDLAKIDLLNSFDQFISSLVNRMSS
jgi:hypothetical protein